MYKKRVIANFNPDYAISKNLVRRRLKLFSYFIASALIVELITLTLLRVFNFNQVVQYLGIICIAAHLLVLVTFFVIFDNGAANTLRKNKFKQNSEPIKLSHTYYHALKKSGYLRALINLSCIALLVITVIICLLV